MDETVDSFLKEINEIVLPKNAWKECYDENSGFTYYWNTQTDDVTWDVPEGYKKLPDQNTKHSKKQLYIPPPSEEKLMLGSLPRLNKDDVKIYKIDEGNISILKHRKRRKSGNSTNKTKYLRKSTSDSEDEKIVLISSYGSESSSDEDPKIQKFTESKPHKTSDSETTRSQRNGRPDVVVVVPPIQTPNEAPCKRANSYDSEDETDLLTQIQTRAKVLKQLGGEVPEGVSRLVDDDRGDEMRKGTTSGGFSLVAGYGDGDSDDESSGNEELPPPPPRNKLFPIICEERETGEATTTASTLFPIPRAVDVSQFSEAPPAERSVSPPPAAAPEPNVDVKAFQRRRRIGVSLLNVQKRRGQQPPPPPPEREDEATVGSERPGFGFTTGTLGETSNKEYLGFKSAGVIFGGASVTAATGNGHTTKVPESVDPVNGATEFGGGVDETDIDESHATLDEKLRFLCEGHNPALPVQVMIIQMETLYTAMKQKCLKPVYLKKWLSNTCEDLTKLELEATPNGWLLLWDRTHKRYYYHNRTSGENQWQYPQPDIVSVDEAMDISTTPPPPPAYEDDRRADNDDDGHQAASMNLVLPPPPPMIKEKSVSPPPPPIISDFNIKENLNNGQPFPPGVDETDDDNDADALHKSKQKEAEPQPEGGGDSFTSELNSFYSDIATMECEQVTKSEIVQPVEVPPAPIKDNGPTETVVVPTSKRKKKVKMGQGLAMKKKGVSKLVEKWKNVQKSYN